MIKASADTLNVVMDYSDALAAEANNTDTFFMLWQAHFIAADTKAAEEKKKAATVQATSSAMAVEPSTPEGVIRVRAPQGQVFVSVPCLIMRVHL